MNARSVRNRFAAVWVVCLLLAAPAAAPAQTYNTTLLETPNGRIFYTAPAGAPYVPLWDAPWSGLWDGAGPYGRSWAPVEAISSSYYGAAFPPVSGLTPAGPTASPVGGLTPDAPGLAPAPATLEVHLPAHAELWIQGRKMSQSGTERRFESPSLEPGSSYVYNVRARWTAHGQAITREQPVMVRAGEVTVMTLVSALAEGPPPTSTDR